MESKSLSSISLPGSEGWFFTAPFPHAFCLFDSRAQLPTLCHFYPLPGTPASVLRALTAVIQDLNHALNPMGPTPTASPLSSPESPDGKPVVYLGLSTAPDWPLESGDHRLLQNSVANRWESAAGMSVVGRPQATYALMGSDPRGLIFALYRWAEAAGISPWHWWSSTAIHAPPGLWLRPDLWVLPEPAVRYRGIFLNDEYPALTRWVAHTYGMATPRDEPPVPPGVANYGTDFYSRIFDLILRLGGNCLWPAMWNNALAEDDPGNLALARDFGIVLGTSHQEPMTRAQKEWDRRYQETLGHWNWQSHQKELVDFWTDGVRRSLDNEVLITLGLRGANDTELTPAQGSNQGIVLEKMVAQQREIIAREYGRPSETIPQVWCLYKEVLDLYHQGMKIPDDVTILWSDDNWGNLRRLPTAEERVRPGGSGMYYHLDYHGSPRSYQWINTSPLEKIQDQMCLAWEYGVGRLWMVNVGHLKGYEISTEFFLRLAWDPPRWQTENLSNFYTFWACRELGNIHGPSAGRVLQQMIHNNGMVKPELLSPTTFTAWPGGEWDQVCARWQDLETQSRLQEVTLEEADRATWFQYLGYPLQASSILYQLYRSAARNLFLDQGDWAGTERWEGRCRGLFEADQALKEFYNHSFAQGRWQHFADQTHLGYLDWCDPPEDSLRGIAFAPHRDSEQPKTAWGISMEGKLLGRDHIIRFMAPSDGCYRLVILPRKGVRVPRGHCVIESTLPWVWASTQALELYGEALIELRVDWDQAPPGTSVGTLGIKGSIECSIPLETILPTNSPPGDFKGFLETLTGVVMNAPNFQSIVPSNQTHWCPLSPYGRWSGAMVARHTQGGYPPDLDPAWLEYHFWLFGSRQGTLSLICGPGLNIFPGKGMGVWVQLDNEPRRYVESISADFVAQHHDPHWESLVAANQEILSLGNFTLTMGAHRIRLGVSEPGFILERIYLEYGSGKPGFFGTPESPLHPPVTVS